MAGRTLLLIAGPLGLLLGGLVVLGVGAARAWGGRGSSPILWSTVLGVVVLFLAVALAGMLRADQLARDPVAGLATCLLYTSPSPRDS